MDIKVQLIPQQLKTYSQVVTIAQEMERRQEKKNLNPMRNQAMKRPVQQMGRGGLVGAIKAQMARRPFRPAHPQITQPLLVCNYFQKPGHFQKDYHRANGLCLVCGFGDHTIEGCPRLFYDFASLHRIF